MKRLVDLSVMIENSPSEPMNVNIKRLDHKKGAKKFCRNAAWNKNFPLKTRIFHFLNYILGKRRITPTDFSNEEFLTLDTVTMPTHMGTHLDAPIHYGSKCQGKEAKSVEELPLDWFYRPGIRIDMTHKKPGDLITKNDVIDYLKCINYTIKPYDIVLIWTGTDQRWGTKEYFTHAPGMGRDAVEWLVNQGVKVIGIDTYGFDRPFGIMLKEFWRTKDHSNLWPSHFYGREKEYIQIERMSNLDKLPSKDFIVSCFPLRLKGADASWIRAVGIY
ncbi:cyclase family protein [Bacillus cytotoxicus]